MSPSRVLVAGGTTSIGGLVTGAPVRRLIAFTHGIDDPASRFRIGQYVPYLEQAGWRVSLRPRRPARPWTRPFPLRRAGLLARRLRRLRDIVAAASYDVAFLNRDLLAGRVEYEERLFRRNPRVVFDFDDAIFLGDKERHIAWICERAAWITAGNDYLAGFARRYSDRVSVLPTVVDTDAYLVRGTRGGTRARVGWLGSDRSIRETLVPFLPIFERLQASLGFDVVVVTHPRPALPSSNLRWTYVAWSPEVETRIADLFDVGVMPLVDDAFQRGKCGCKILQYMAAGLPVVVSPVGVNANLVDGTLGYLASSEDDWKGAIASLLADGDLRLAMGSAGRAFVERKYSVRRWVPELLEILDRVSR